MGKIRQYLRQRLSIEEAVNKTVDECIAENIMKDYLLLNKAGVIYISPYKFGFEKIQLTLRTTAYVVVFLLAKGRINACEKLEFMLS